MKENYDLCWDRVGTRCVYTEKRGFEAGALYDSAEDKVNDLNDTLSNNKNVRENLRWNLLTDGYMQEYGKYQYAKGLFIGGLTVMASACGGYMTGKLIKRRREKKH